MDRSPRRCGRAPHRRARARCARAVFHTCNNMQKTSRCMQICALPGRLGDLQALVPLCYKLSSVKNMLARYHLTRPLQRTRAVPPRVPLQSRASWQAARRAARAARPPPRCCLASSPAPPAATSRRSHCVVLRWSQLGCDHHKWCAAAALVSACSNRDTKQITPCSEQNVAEMHLHELDGKTASVKVETGMQVK